MEKSVAYGLIAVVVVIVFGIIGFIISSDSDPRVDLKTLPAKEAAGKVAAVEANVVSYDMIVGYNSQMSMSLMSANMDMKVTGNFTGNVDRANQEMLMEGELNITYQMGKMNFDLGDEGEFSFGGLGGMMSYSNMTRMRVEIKNNKVTIEQGGKVKVAAMMEGDWENRDFLANLGYQINRSGFTYLPDEEIGGEDYYVMRLNTSDFSGVPEVAGGAVEGGAIDSFDYSDLENDDFSDFSPTLSPTYMDEEDNDGKVSYDYIVWVNKDSLLIERGRITMTTSMGTGQDIVLTIDYFIKNVKYG